MAASSADDHLTVGGDADVVVSESRCDAACTSLHVSVRWLLDGGTQSMVLSAAIDHPSDAEPHCGPNSIVLPARRHASMTPAPRGVVPEPARRATGRVLYPGGHGHRVLPIPV